MPFTAFGAYLFGSSLTDQGSIDFLLAGDGPIDTPAVLVFIADQLLLRFVSGAEFKKSLYCSLR